MKTFIKISIGSINKVGGAVPTTVLRSGKVCNDLTIVGSKDVK